MLFCTKGKSVFIDYSKVTHVTKYEEGFTVFFVSGKDVYLSLEEGADFIASWVKYKSEENKIN